MENNLIKFANQYNVKQSDERSPYRLHAWAHEDNFKIKLRLALKRRYIGLDCTKIVFRIEKVYDKSIGMESAIEDMIDRFECIDFSFLDKIL